MGHFDAGKEHCMAALDAAQMLFKHLCALGRLSIDFTVYGLRQVRPLESPCLELYSLIQKWPQWVCFDNFDESLALQRII
jgi:hypothetical protein